MSLSTSRSHGRALNFFDLILCGENYLRISLWCISIYRLRGAYGRFMCCTLPALTYVGQDRYGRYRNIYIIYISVHYEQLIEFSVVLLPLLLCSSLWKHTWVCSVAYHKGQLLIFSWEPVALPWFLGTTANVFTNSFSLSRPFYYVFPFFCHTKALCGACVWSPRDAGPARSRLSARLWAGGSVNPCN